MSQFLIEILPEPNGQSTDYPLDFEAIKFRGTTLMVVEICLLTSNPAVIEAQLTQKMNGPSGKLRQAPVILNLESPEIGPDLDLPGLLALLRGFDLIPVGVRGARGELLTLASASGLPLIPEGKSPSAGQRAGHEGRALQELQEDKEEQSARPRKSNPEPMTNQAASTLTITRPVRSGQRVYAAGGDLILLAAVNAGAEVLADGNIHAYAALRGRALAGARGNAKASIFCQSLEAELVSIAGFYQVIEDMPQEALSQPVQITLDEDQLRFIHLYEKNNRSKLPRK